MAVNKDYMNCLLDSQIKSYDADAFGHRHFATALESLIESPQNEPPYTIGVLGKWGTGKSSIKQLYLQPLEDARKNKDEAANRKTRWLKIAQGLGGIFRAKMTAETPAREERIHCITFNAWRFGGENIKRALLRHVFIKLGGDESRINDALFRQIQRQEIEARNFQAMLREAYDKWLWTLLQLVIVFGLIIGGLFVIKSQSGANAEWLSGAIVTLYAIAGMAAIQALLDPKRFAVSRYGNVARVESPRTSAEEYEDLLIYQLKNFKSSEHGKQVERIVIFVDDLDRLSAEEMVSGLDAIRTFMEMPVERLPQKLGVIFVVSCDEDRVADALAARSRTAGDDSQPTILILGDARRFLDRIFQFRLEIPPFPKQDMRDFAIRKIRDELIPIAEALEARQVSLEELVERMIPVSVQSPRNALHILNAFVQGWWLATQREADALCNKPGGLPEGAVTKYPLVLAALCTLRVNFPDFYGNLQQEPFLIQYFTDVFIDKLGPASKESLDQLPERAAGILECYDDDTGSLGRIHWPLRQYLASLRALNWPPSLQPFLVFSQDPLARAFGDRYERVYADLISGNTPGVLDGLGYKNDTESISREHARQLYNWVEDILDRENNVRQDSAATVLAALAARLPKDQARWLLNPFAKRLASSAELRWRIRIPTIRDVLEHARPVDRKEVVGKIIDDLLLVQGSITQPENSADHSVDDIKEMVRDAVHLALWARRQDNGRGLDKEHEAKLFRWIEDRRIFFAFKEVLLPFSDFDNWMAEYESDLLPSSGVTYAYALAAELKADQMKELDMNAALSRARKVLATLEKADEEGQNHFWTLLSRFVSVKKEAAVSLSLEFAERNYKNALPASIQNFVHMLAWLNTQGAGDNHTMAGEKRAASVMLDILEARSQVLDWKLVEGPVPDRNLVDHVSSLVVIWSTSDATSESAIRLLDCISKVDLETANSLIQGWAWRVLADLSDNCQKWLAEKFSTSLAAGQRGQVVESLQMFWTARQPADDEAWKKFDSFMRRLPADAFSIPEMQGFINNIFTYRAEVRIDDDGTYLRTIFVTLPFLIRHASVVDAVNFLSAVFKAAAEDHNLYGYLHRQMADYWTADLDVAANEIFEQSQSIAAAHAREESALSILTFMHKMIQKGVIESRYAAALIDTACLLWPYHQEACLEILLSYEQAPEPRQVADLINAVSPGDTVALNRLSKAWSHMAEYLTLEQAIDVTRHIIEMRREKSETDDYLKSWIQAQNHERGSELIRSIMNGELIDEHWKRLKDILELIRAEKFVH